MFNISIERLGVEFTHTFLALSEVYQQNSIKPSWMCWRGRQIMVYGHFGFVFVVMRCSSDLTGRSIDDCRSDVCLNFVRCTARYSTIHFENTYECACHSTLWSLQIFMFLRVLQPCTVISNFVLRWVKRKKLVGKSLFWWALCICTKKLKAFVVDE